MANLTRYQEPQQELARHVRRELVRSTDQIHYITESVLTAQASMGRLQAKGTCLMVQAAASSHVLIKAAELDGVSPECIEVLKTMQLQFLIRMSQTAERGSVKLLRLIDELSTLPPASLLDWLERFLEDYSR